MLFVREHGTTGPLLITLHGGPGAPGGMLALARRLADRYHVIEPFQRASGDTPLTVAHHIEDLRELICSRAVDSPPVLLGSSWGAMLALAYAAEHPQSTGPLILVGCGTFDLGARARMQETIAQRISTEARKRLELAEQLANPDERLKAFADALAPIYSYDPLPSSLGNEKVDAKAQQETWDDMVRLQIEGTYPAAFTNIQVPVLMVHGDYDPHPGHLIRDSLRPYLPQLEYRELEHCGHYPWQEKYAAETLFALIYDWLRQNERSSAKHD
jgi:pimeloyl-ACP methyl ester carboxylesterase